jgi:hypothetical protein
MGNEFMILCWDGYTVDCFMLVSHVSSLIRCGFGMGRSIEYTGFLKIRNASREEIVLGAFF